MLELKNITVAFKNHTVINDLSLSAEKGEIIGLAAPNGMGKTTLFNVMANYVKPNSGQVIVDGEDTFSSEKKELKIHKKMTTFPDQSDLFEELSGIDHMKLYADIWNGDRKSIKTIINELNMEGYVKDKVKTYSLGMRQRLCFAMMAAANSPIMLMDEVMNGLDLSNVALISNKLIEMKNNQKLIFVASHLLENLDLYADRVLFLKDGDIVHEHKLGDRDSFIKGIVSKKDYQRMNDQYVIPKGHRFISDRLLCIPFGSLPLNEQTTWMERMLEAGAEDLTIGPMGTLEHYEQHYHSEEETLLMSRK